MLLNCHYNLIVFVTIVVVGCMGFVFVEMFISAETTNRSSITLLLIYDASSY